ncbi:Hypothetical protein NTJ_03080 [Nesidiocoris tenuis]|uniref:Uncharacterized protein n=1 Tax=Nesidiocoris tenuis TaxID=355587 RepID=A0ABN7AG90_9HEMI|nr:Hypothetical protein NTJ_03080 [Nesidiocoris tenuis]
MQNTRLLSEEPHLSVAHRRHEEGGEAEEEEEVSPFGGAYGGGTAARGGGRVRKNSAEDPTRLCCDLGHRQRCRRAGRRWGGGGQACQRAGAPFPARAVDTPLVRPRASRPSAHREPDERQSRTQPSRPRRRRPQGGVAAVPAGLAPPEGLRGGPAVLTLQNTGCRRAPIL